MGHICELTDEQRFEVFINKSLKQYREKMSLKGTQNGRSLNDEEMISAIKLHSQSIKKEEEYDQLAKTVNFDIDSAAQKAVSVSDPNQIVIQIIR